MKDTRLYSTSFIPEAFVNTNYRFWQVFWLTFLSDAFPSVLSRTVAGVQKELKGLQLRVQLRILTGFPFDSDRKTIIETKSATKI